MNINKSSWHFKLIDSFYSNKTYDGCEYFKRLSKACLIIFVMLISSVSVVGFLGYAFITLTEIPHVMPSIVMYLLLGIPVTGFIVVIVIVVLDILDTIDNHLQYRKRNSDKSSNSGLFMSWLKSKTGKYCSQITYKD